MITLIMPKSEFLIDQAVFPPLGLMYLSAFLKKYDIPVQVLDMGLGHTLDMVKYDIVGVSVTTPQYPAYKELEKELKARGKRVVVGGAHATHAPQDFLEAEHIFAGYSEAALVNWLLQKNVCEQPEDIDDFPYPDRSCLPIKKYKYFIDGELATTLMSSRGCPFRCSFCAKIDNRFDYQTAERTIEEVLHLYNQYGYKAFMIFDDLFTFNATRLKQIACGLGSYGFKFRCFVRSDLITPDVCALLWQLGVREVGIGIESGSDDVLSMNMKKTTVAKHKDALKLLKQFEIRRKAFIIIGLPGETKETIKQTEAFIEEAQPDNVDLTVCQVYPGSLIYKNPVGFGWSDSLVSSYDGYKAHPDKYHLRYAPNGLPVEFLLSERKRLEERFKKW